MTGQEAQDPEETRGPQEAQDEQDRECREAVERRMEQLYQYLDGALTPEEVDEVRSHVEECPDCRRQRELEELIRDAVRRSCQEKAPEQLRSAILTRITQVSTTVTWR